MTRKTIWRMVCVTLMPCVWIFDFPRKSWNRYMFADIDFFSEALLQRHEKRLIPCTLGWRKNISYFYFPSLISNCIIYSIKKIFAKGTAKQKIFRGRLKVLKISILLKMMNFFCIKPSLLQLFFILWLLMKTRAKD